MIALLAPLNFVDSLLLKFFSEQTVNYVIWPFIQVGAVVTITAGWVAYATYLERKISAFIQARLGPMRVGPWGLLQPIADGLKLLVKEDFIPENADRWVFFIAPYIAVVAAFIVMAVVPFGPDWAVITDINIGVLFVLAVSSVGVLATILAGWSSNSKYALLGALRSSAQMVSYEVSMGLAIIGALMFARTLSLSGIVAAQASDSIWFLLYQPIGFVIFLISGIAENNRAPFDLPEAESELVWTLPRFRYDQLMDLGWKWMLPAALVNIVVSAIAVFTLQALDGWHGIHTIESLTGGLNLTAAGKGIAIAIGVANLFLTAAILSMINWRSRDFNLKKQRRKIRLVDLPKGKPAVAPVAVSEQ